MKFIVLFLTACVLGSAVAHPGWLSSISDATNAVKNTAVNAAKATTNTAVNAAKATTNTAMNAATATKDMAVNTVGYVKDTTGNLATAGVNFVKDVSASAVNVGVGILLQQVRGLSKMSGKNVIEIPDIVYENRVIGFTATKGYFKDIATLVQDGKVNVTTNGTTLIIDVPIKLGDIDVGYEQFNVSALMMNFGGGIKVKIGNDSFIIHLKLKPGLTCALSVDRVEVAALSEFDIDFINVGKAAEWMLEKSSNLMINAIKGQIKSKVQAAIDQAVKDALKAEGAMICSKFMM